MPQSPSPQQQRERQELFRQLRALGTFLRSTDVGRFLQHFDAELERAYHARTIADLRGERDELLTLAFQFSGTELRRLDTILREQAGISLDELDTRRLARIRRLREAGRITRDAEYQLLAARLDQIEGVPEHAQEIDELSRLMATYESRRVRPKKGPSSQQHN